jgi:hypothetical protein
MTMSVRVLAAGAKLETRPLPALPVAVTLSSVK